ncbi:lipopolysaccharide assembly protein LapA domain-containing protein [Pseudomarimonas arenosa]|uniref:DUF1049 domain-containing protein n=1 Tax=Pseudomarimonas arenosa TaxID=2774145 RepID=A0AAW3ZGM8_9GAMM|nr:lipopolysaccharide assembly protein LapA domain-containing protein [Pseudomarimonas arenosa]MBD8524585.1 DUF1049 domain-containing protein [Pseudomarimonas arenosa]
MRLLTWILAAAAVFVGLGFGALNGAPVSIDLYFTNLQLPLGGALLSALLLGTALGGGCVWLLRVWPLSTQLRRAQQAKSGNGGKRNDKKLTPA